MNKGKHPHINKRRILYAYTGSDNDPNDVLRDDDNREQCLSFVDGRGVGHCDGGFHKVSHDVDGRSYGGY